VSAERYEVVVKGRLSPTLVGALQGFDVIGVDNGHTHLVGPAEGQGFIHELRTVLRGLNTELISLVSAPGITGRPQSPALPLRAPRRVGWTTGWRHLRLARSAGV
jgi:hypothetical protein